MAIDVLDILRAKKMSPMEDHFDRICLPLPMAFYLSPQDIEALRKIATSVKLAGKIREKYKMIDDIMRARGFKRFAAGTNRVVYSFYEDPSFLVKIAVDRVGMQDNPMEYQNQFFLKPYVSKMFCISPCGTVGFAERVIPIKNIAEFKEIASDVFDILVTKFLGKYVVEDVGTKYFMNWGIRIGHGPVLLDYPYVYKLDGKKLYCNEFLPDFNCICNGEIDYNSGFNHLVCGRCGKIYLAVDLRDNTPDNKKIIAKGGYSMKVQLVRGNEVVFDPIPMDDTITKQKAPKKPVGEQRLHAVLEGRAISKKSDEEVVETPIVTPPAEETATEEVETTIPAEEETVTPAETETEEVEGDMTETDEVDAEEEDSSEESEVKHGMTWDPNGPNIAEVQTEGTSTDEESDDKEDESEEDEEEIVTPSTDLVADEEDLTVQEELDDLRFIPHPSGRVQAMRNRKFVSMKDIPEDKIPDWVKEANAKADAASNKRRERKSPKTVHIPASK